MSDLNNEQIAKLRVDFANAFLNNLTSQQGPKPKETLESQYLSLAKQHGYSFLHKEKLLMISALLLKSSEETLTGEQDCDEFESALELIKNDLMKQFVKKCEQELSKDFSNVYQLLMTVLEEELPELEQEEQYFDARTGNESPEKQALIERTNHAQASHSNAQAFNANDDDDEGTCAAWLSWGQRQLSWGAHQLTQRLEPHKPRMHAANLAVSGFFASASLRAQQARENAVDCFYQGLDKLDQEFSKFSRLPDDEQEESLDQHEHESGMKR